MKKGLTLFLGMYAITVFLFWFETGSVYTGLLFGVISASLKTVWVKIHNWITHTKKPCPCCEL